MVTGELLIFSFILMVLALVLGGFAVTFWIMFVIVRAVCRGTLAAFGVHPRRPVTANSCTRALCRAENPPGARFCRRCGKELAAGYAYARSVEGAVVR